MEVCEISTGSCEGNVDELKKMVENSNPEFKRVILNVTPMPLPIQTPDDWPIIFECTVQGKDTEIRIDRLTCGFRGKGPKNLVKALHIAGFESFFKDEEIYEKKRITETFVKF